jgi:heme/copper-type cytochrome/quinol oxidase subunit 2
MPQRKPYNPNTKYGRKKTREHYYNTQMNGTPEQKKEQNNIEWVVTIVAILIVALITFLVGGVDGLMKLGGK